MIGSTLLKLCGLVLSWSLVLALVAPVSAAPLAPPSTLVVPGLAMEASLRTDGTTLLWVKPRRDSAGDTTGYYDIYAVSLSDRQIFSITAGRPGSASDPDIANGIIVWAQSGPDSPIHNRDIYTKNLATGEEFVIAATSADETRPAISGSLVIWISDDGQTRQLMGRDISTMSPSFAIAQNLAEHQIPALHGDRVVWAEQVTRADGSVVDSVFTRTLGGTMQPVVQDLLPPGYFRFDSAGDVIVYTPNGVDLALFNVKTGETTSLATFANAPTTDGRYVCWSQGGNFHEPYGQIECYDLVSRIDFDATPYYGQRRWRTAEDFFYNNSPQLRAGMLIWRQYYGPEVGIHAAMMTNVLPIAPRPAPLFVNPNLVYFPQTGHILASTFKAFWERSGGLSVFGYPLTEAFKEPNADDGQMYTTQYYERQRFEYHPEHAGTPYEILLGRLGVDDAKRRGLLGSDPFRPLPAGALGGVSCTVLAQTGHQICGDFRGYWQRHGLEFGDRGVSFRESLALLGYPISEEFVDPATGLLVQYFERARLEHHPENRAPYTVLLGRLSADMLTERQ